MDVEDCIRVKEFGQVKKEISMKLFVFYKGHNLLTYKGKGHLGILVQISRQQRFSIVYKSRVVHFGHNILLILGGGVRCYR